MGSRPDQHVFEQRLREHRRLIAKVASVYAAGAEDRRPGFTGEALAGGNHATT